MKVTAGYFSNPPAVSNKKENQAKILLLHKAADIQYFQTNSGTTSLAEMFPYESIPFHTENEFDEC